MKDIQAIIPEKWPSNNDVPWLEGESCMTKICKRFHILSEGILPQFRKFFSDLKCVQTEFNERMIQGFLYIILKSSAETGRGFSKVNLVCTKMRSRFMVKHLSSLMFISTNGPPVHLWDTRIATSKWLQKHKSANDNRKMKFKQESFSDLNRVQQLPLEKEK